MTGVLILGRKYSIKIFYDGFYFVDSEKLKQTVVLCGRKS